MGKFGLAAALKRFVRKEAATATKPGQGKDDKPKVRKQAAEAHLQQASMQCTPLRSQSGNRHITQSHGEGRPSVEKAAAASKAIIMKHKASLVQSVKKPGGAENQQQQQQHKGKRPSQTNPGTSDTKQNSNNNHSYADANATFQPHRAATASKSQLENTGVAPSKPSKQPAQSRAAKDTVAGTSKKLVNPQKSLDLSPSIPSATLNTYTTPNAKALAANRQDILQTGTETGGPAVNKEANPKPTPLRTPTTNQATPATKQTAGNIANPSVLHSLRQPATTPNAGSSQAGPNAVNNAGSVLKSSAQDVHIQQEIMHDQVASNKKQRLRKCHLASSEHLVDAVSVPEADVLQQVQEASQQHAGAYNKHVTETAIAGTTPLKQAVASAAFATPVDKVANQKKGSSRRQDAAIQPSDDAVARSVSKKQHEAMGSQAGPSVAGEQQSKSKGKQPASNSEEAGKKQPSTTDPAANATAEPVDKQADAAATKMAVNEANKGSSAGIRRRPMTMLPILPTTKRNAAPDTKAVAGSQNKDVAPAVSPVKTATQSAAKPARVASTNDAGAPVTVLTAENATNPLAVLTSRPQPVTPTAGTSKGRDNGVGAAGSHLKRMTQDVQEQPSVIGDQQSTKKQKRKQLSSRTSEEGAEQGLLLLAAVAVSEQAVAAQRASSQPDTLLTGNRIDDVAANIEPAAATRATTTADKHGTQTGADYHVPAERLDTIEAGQGSQLQDNTTGMHVDATEERNARKSKVSSSKASGGKAGSKRPTASTKTVGQPVEPTEQQTDVRAQTNAVVEANNQHLAGTPQRSTAILQAAAVNAAPIMKTVAAIQNRDTVPAVSPVKTATKSAAKPSKVASTNNDGAPASMLAAENATNPPAVLTSRPQPVTPTAGTSKGRQTGVVEKAGSHLERAAPDVQEQHIDTSDQQSKKKRKRKQASSKPSEEMAEPGSLLPIAAAVPEQDAQLVSSQPDTLPASDRTGDMPAHSEPATAAAAGVTAAEDNDGTIDDPNHHAAVEHLDDTEAGSGRQLHDETMEMQVEPREEQETGKNKKSSGKAAAGKAGSKRSKASKQTATQQVELTGRQADVTPQTNAVVEENVQRRVTRQQSTAILPPAARDALPDLEAVTAGQRGNKQASARRPLRKATQGKSTPSVAEAAAEPADAPTATATAADDMVDDTTAEDEAELATPQVSRKRKSRADDVSWREDRQRTDVKQGPFSDAEAQAIRDAIEQYAVAKGLGTENPTWLFGTRKSGYTGAMTEIAMTACPHRKRASVADWCRRHLILQPVKKGKWSKSETDLLLELVEEYGNQWTAIGYEIGRTAEQCRDKYRLMGGKNHDKKQKGPFSHAEIAKLKRLVKEYHETRSAAEAALQEAQLEATEEQLPGKKSPGMRKAGGQLLQDNIDWDYIASEMGSRSAIQCRLAWYRRYAEPLPGAVPWKGEDTDILLKALADGEYKHEWEVPWGECVPDRKEQDVRRAWTRLKMLFKEWRNMELPELVARLCKVQLEHTGSEAAQQAGEAEAEEAPPPPPAAAAGREEEEEEEAHEDVDDAQPRPAKRARTARKSAASRRNVEAQAAQRRNRKAQAAVPTAGNGEPQASHRQTRAIAALDGAAEGDEARPSKRARKAAAAKAATVTAGNGVAVPSERAKPAARGTAATTDNGEAQPNRRKPRAEKAAATSKDDGEALLTQEGHPAMAAMAAANDGEPVSKRKRRRLAKEAAAAAAAQQGLTAVNNNVPTAGLLPAGADDDGVEHGPSQGVANTVAELLNIQPAAGKQAKVPGRGKVNNTASAHNAAALLGGSHKNTKPERAVQKSNTGKQGSQHDGTTSNARGNGIEAGNKDVKAMNNGKPALEKATTKGTRSKDVLKAGNGSGRRVDLAKKDVAKGNNNNNNNNTFAAIQRARKPVVRSLLASYGETDAWDEGEAGGNTTGNDVAVKHGNNRKLASQPMQHVGSSDADNSSNSDAVDSGSISDADNRSSDADDNMSRRGSDSDDTSNDPDDNDNTWEAGRLDKDYDDMNEHYHTNNTYDMRKDLVMDKHDDIGEEYDLGNDFDAYYDDDLDMD